MAPAMRRHKTMPPALRPIAIIAPDAWRRPFLLPRASGVQHTFGERGRSARCRAHDRPKSQNGAVPRTMLRCMTRRYLFIS
jgi:hypothetical protein